MDRCCKGNGWCAQLEKLDICFCCKLSSNVNAVLSADEFSDWSNASVRLAEHEKYSSHSQASVHWFEAEQRLKQMVARWIH